MQGAVASSYNIPVSEIAIALRVDNVLLFQTYFFSMFRRKPHARKEAELHAMLLFSDACGESIHLLKLSDGSST